jgi:glycerate 2-kinase
VISRERCEAAFRAAVAACDPERHVRLALSPLGERHVRVDPGWFAGRKRFGIAVGKAALGMARGAGPVDVGVAVTHVDDGGALPPGWQRLVSSHPEPDARSVAAADQVIEVVERAGRADVVLALISGGASALVEKPAPGVTLEHLRERIRTLAAQGASIRELNRARSSLSAIKGGKLAERCRAPIVTLVVSDVIGDDPAIVGSGPTVSRRAGDHVLVVAPMHGFVEEVGTQLGIRVKLGAEDRDVTALAAFLEQCPTILAWGEPTLAIPENHGEGGRAQQLALELAKRIRGTDRSAFIAGSDGQDGPAPLARPAPAGAYVDGTTWDAILAAGLDPSLALSRRDAGTALHAAGALFITGPTGVNHADIMVIG